MSNKLHLFHINIIEERERKKYYVYSFFLIKQY